MGLITITDIEAALGVDVSSDEEPRIQWYIDAVSSFIVDYTSQDFLPHVAEALVCQADGGGVIEFQDLTSVSKVELYDQWQKLYSEVVAGDYRFDGISKILFLAPGETYRVTATYGFTVVPPSIKAIATQLVLAGTGLDRMAAGGLKSFRIGDEEVVYGVTLSDTGSPQVTLSGLQRNSLDSYSPGSHTWRLL